MRSLAMSLIFGMCLLIPIALNADTIYAGSIAGCGCQVFASPAGFSIHYDTSQVGYNSGGTGNTTASASAGGSSLGAAAHAWVDLPTGYPASVQAGTSSGSSFDQFEVIISGPSNQQATISLNMALDGTLSATANGSQTQSFFASANLYVSGSLSGPHGSASFSGNLLQKEYGGATSVTDDFVSSGVLSGFQGASGNFTTLSMLAFGGDHIIVRMGIAGTAYCEESYGSGTFSCDAIADYAHTLAFPSSGPVFNLPVGWSADSVDGAIVNNQFVTTGLAVPEPSSLVLLGSALIAVAGRIRKRSRR